MRGIRIRQMLETLAQRDAERPVEEAMDHWVETHGPGAAAWLLWNFRARLHRHGAVDLHVPKGEVLPPWARVAIEAIRRRPHWVVVEMTLRGQRQFRVRWTQWGRYARTTTSAEPAS